MWYILIVGCGEGIHKNHAGYDLRWEVITVDKNVAAQPSIVGDITDVNLLSELKKKYPNKFDRIYFEYVDSYVFTTHTTFDLILDTMQFIGKCPHYLRIATAAINEESKQELTNRIIAHGYKISYDSSAPRREDDAGNYDICFVK